MWRKLSKEPRRFAGKAATRSTSVRTRSRPSRWTAIATEDKDAAVAKLFEWFEDSCGLRFIQAIREAKEGEEDRVGWDGMKYSDPIRQFEYEDDDRD